MIRICYNKKKTIKEHFKNIIDYNTFHIYIDDNEINDKIEILI